MADKVKKNENGKNRFYDIWVENKKAYYVSDSGDYVYNVGFIDEKKALERADAEYEDYRVIKFDYYDYDVIELSN